MSPQFILFTLSLSLSVSTANASNSNLRFAPTLTHQFDSLFGILSLKFDFQSCSFFISSFHSLASLDLLSSLSIFVYVLWICGLLVFGFVDLFFRFLIHVPSLVFDLSLSIEVEANRCPLEADPTQTLVFRSRQWVFCLATPTGSHWF